MVTYCIYYSSDVLLMQTASKQIEHQCLLSILLQKYCDLMTREMET